MINVEENNEFHQIDDLEHKLYDPKQKDEEFGLHHIQNHNLDEIPTDWGNNGAVISPSSENEGYSFGAKILFIAMFFLCLALAFTAWRVLSSRNVVSSSNIDINIDNKPYVEGGEATPLSVSILNRNTISLQEAVLTISYERGMGIQNEQEKVYEKRVLGTINPNSLKKEDMTISLYGAESDTRDISVKLEYKVSGANAVFDKTVTTSVVLKTPPLSIHIDGPENLVQGQEGVFKVSVSNNTSSLIENSLVSISLPTTFSLRNSDPIISSHGFNWPLTSMPPGSTSTLTLYGSFMGEPGEIATIKSSVGNNIGSNQMGIVYSQEVKSVFLTEPLLALSSRLETDRGSAENLRFGDRAVIYISYINKSDKPLTDVSVIANISGNAAVNSDIGSDDGYYNSINRTVTWNKATNNSFSYLVPGAKGELRLSVPIITKGGDSPKFNLTIKGEATSVTKSDTSSELFKSWTVQGSANLSAWTSYKNKSFSNVGPLPPKANIDTSYAAHIAISAQNSLVNSKVSFILPIYVNYTGVSSVGNNVTYNERTRTVVWNIGNIGAGQALFSDIQLNVRPSLTHVGEIPPITSGITFEADESDSKAHIRIVSSAITTDLSRESGGQDLSHVLEN